jgi:hypothetical protein
VFRYTFVVQVHPGGISTLENLATRERVQVAEVAAVGAQIEQWLEVLTEREDAGEPGPGGSGSSSRSCDGSASRS